MKICPVILCGGSGTRLWPLSRKSYPKQFSALLGEKSLFQGCVERLSGEGYSDPIVLTNDAFRFIANEQLNQSGIHAGSIMIEPSGRNTAPAVLAAALWLERTAPDSLILVAPSDHVIPGTNEFRAAVEGAAEEARAGNFVTFGIAPNRPETGYGYLELAEGGSPAADAPQPLQCFVEKPNTERAIEMLASGRYLWNAGIFLMSVATAMAAYREHLPEMVELAAKAVDEATEDLNFIRLDADSWDQLEDISIDYAIMEKVSNLAVMPYRGVWSDLGDWVSVWRESDPDEAGNACSQHATAIDCSNSLLRSENPDQELVGIGLEDIVAVAMPDAVLVAHKSEAQRVREAVSALKGKSAGQATRFPREHRPWGWFESLVIGARFQVKRIVVHPGAALSLQSHHHRSEHWIVVEGTARVTVDDDIRLVTENQSLYIPLGSVHRLENPGKVDMVLIEVQTGSYLGEDDIIRYEDLYSRV